MIIRILVCYISWRSIYSSHLVWMLIRTYSLIRGDLGPYTSYAFNATRFF